MILAGLSEISLPGQFYGWGYYMMTATYLFLCFYGCEGARRLFL